MFIVQWIKSLFCLYSIVLIFVWRMELLGVLKAKRLITFSLVGMALLSIPLYFDLGYYPKQGRFMNVHSWFHYYLGAKYLPEVGYYDLYRAVVVANEENNGRLMQQRLRNLETYEVESARAVSRRSDEYRGLFSEARWEEFKADVDYFQSVFIPRRWPGVVNDKGYNATPTWSMTGNLLANTFPIRSGPSWLFLFSLDFLLMAAMLAFVWRALGPRVMLFMAIYLLTHFAFFMYNVNEIRGSFLRLDWVMLTVIGVCLLKLQHYTVAGAVMAYAAMARIFPTVFVFGIGAVALWALFKHRRPDGRHVRFFVSFGVVSVLLVGASIWWSGGLELWREFFEKVAMHDRDLSPQRTGFKYLYLGTYEGSEGKLEVWESQMGVWWTIQAGVLVLCFFAVRRLEDWEAVAFSYVPMFFLFAPTTYYQIALLVPMMLFLPKLGDFTRAAGASGLFFVSIVFAILNNAGFPGGNYAKSFVLSCFLGLVAVYLIRTGFAARAAEPPLLEREHTQES